MYIDKLQENLDFTETRKDPLKDLLQPNTESEKSLELQTVDTTNSEKIIIIFHGGLYTSNLKLPHHTYNQKLIT